MADGGVLSRTNVKKCSALHTQRTREAPGPPFILNVCCGGVAQLVEQRTFNPCVPGSNPGALTKSVECAHRTTTPCASALPMGCQSPVVGGASRMPCRSTIELSVCARDCRHVRSIVGVCPDAKLSWCGGWRTVLRRRRRYVRAGRRHASPPQRPVERSIAEPRTRAMFETLRRCRDGMGCTRAVG
jgi:hypothetical protein